MSRILLLLATLVAFAGEPLQAQERHGAAPDDGPVAFLLEHRYQLRLSAEQVTKLEEIHSGLESLNRPLMARVGVIRGEMRALGPREELSAEQLARFESRVGEVRSIMERMQKNNWSAMEDVGHVLTHRQKRRLATLIEERGDTIRGRSGDLFGPSGPRN